MNASIKDTIQQLEELFEMFNSKFFGGKLPKAVITVSPDTTRGAYGWCTSWKAWKESGHESEGYYEINMCAEYLSRPFEEIACTMLHEMVHLYNLEIGVKDTSRGGFYHNKKYKEAAEAHALHVEKNEKYGWHKTTLTAEAKAAVEEYKKASGKTAFDLYRENPKKTVATTSDETESGEDETETKKSSSRKYVCPCCGISVRATKEVRVACFDCGMLMIEEK